MSVSYKAQVESLTATLVQYEKEYVTNSTALYSLRDRYLVAVEDY